MIRISYTLIDTWLKKGKDEAVAYYLGARQEPTKAMSYGIDFDEKLKNYINVNNRLPDTLGGKSLTNPLCQKKFEIADTNNDIMFVFVPDLIDSNELYEFKTGSTELSNYLSSMQIPVYLYLLNYADIKIDKAYLINETQGWYIIRNTDSIMTKAKDWLYENANAIKSYFTEMGI